MLRRVLPFVALVVALCENRAQAIPILQLYLEGGTYDTTTETWELTPPGGSNGGAFRIWAIGNVDGAGGKGTIYDVKLSAVYDSTVGPITITLTPDTAGGVGLYNGFYDPSTPSLTGGLIQIVSDGSSPLMGDGTPLASHGEYGTGRTWQEFGLGDFSLTDSNSGDFSMGFPTAGSPGFQINVYDVTVTGPFGEHPFDIHFDLYDHVGSGTKAKYVFAPFSHDAEGGGGGVDANATIAPEPASATLIGAALLSLLGGGGWRLRRKPRVVAA